MEDTTRERDHGAVTPEEDLMQRLLLVEASTSENVAGLVGAGAGENQAQPGSPELGYTVSGEFRLAEWLKAQLQLPEYVSAEDWTPEHTSEFARFCADPNRKHWFLWMEHPGKPRGGDDKIALGQEVHSISHKRLAFADQLCADGVRQLLKSAAALEESGAAFVFAVKKTVTVVLSRPLEEQLLCLSLQGPLLQQLAAIIRGVCIPLLRENRLWPESLKKGILRREDVAAAARLADGNLRFLQVLKAPCQALSKADLEHMPDIIAELLMAVRVVATHSEYYTTPGRIGGIARNSVWIRVVCCEPLCSLAPLPRPSDAFVQRCSDLLDVCLAQLQFNPTSQLKCREAASKSKEGRSVELPSGHSCFGHSCLPFFGAFQTEAIRGNLKELQEVFAKSLARLKTMGRSVLQVKETKWHTEYALFREQVEDQSKIEA
ncbi:hypothetical protein Emag_003815 [Eimeria magna]